MKPEPFSLRLLNKIHSCGFLFCFESLSTDSTVVNNCMHCYQYTAETMCFLVLNLTLNPQVFSLYLSVLYDVCCYSIC